MRICRGAVFPLDDLYVPQSGTDQQINTLFLRLAPLSLVDEYMNCSCGETVPSWSAIKLQPYTSNYIKYRQFDQRPLICLGRTCAIKLSVASLHLALCLLLSLPLSVCLSLSLSLSLSPSPSLSLSLCLSFTRTLFASFQSPDYFLPLTSLLLCFLPFIHSLFIKLYSSIINSCASAIFRWVIHTKCIGKR